MLVAVVSVKGSPGVTTFAVALAARWPSSPGGPAARPVVVEADPAGGDLAVRLGLRSAPGLAGFAAAVRHRPDAAVLWQHARPLPGGVSVVAAPADADQAGVAVATLTAGDGPGVGMLRSAADLPGAVVVVDGGRVDPGSPVLPILAAADVMLVLARPRADDLAHLVRRLPQIGGWCRRPQLLLAGRGHSFHEVARELGVTALRRIPDDPAGAAVLGGAPEARWWKARSSPERSALGQAACEVALDVIRLAGPAPAPAPAPAPEASASAAAAESPDGARRRWVGSRRRAVS